MRVSRPWYVLDRYTIMSNLRVVASPKAFSGGHVVSFVCTLSGLGPGRLGPPENSNQDEKLDDRKFYAPRDNVWNNLGEACANAGVGVSMFMAPAKFLDIASIGICLRLSGNTRCLVEHREPRCCALTVWWRYFLSLGLQTAARWPNFGVTTTPTCDAYDRLQLLRPRSRFLWLSPRPLSGPSRLE